MSDFTVVQERSCTVDSVSKFGDEIEEERESRCDSEEVKSVETIIWENRLQSEKRLKGPQKQVQNGAKRGAADEEAEREELKGGSGSAKANLYVSEDEASRARDLVMRDTEPCVDMLRED